MMGSCIFGERYWEKEGTLNPIIMWSKVISHSTSCDGATAWEPVKMTLES